jgi:hypothetical protein
MVVITLPVLYTIDIIKKKKQNSTVIKSIKTYFIQNFYNREKQVSVELGF